MDEANGILFRKLEEEEYRVLRREIFGDEEETSSL